MANITTPGLKFDGLNATLGGSLTIPTGSYNEIVFTGSGGAKILAPIEMYLQASNDIYLMSHSSVNVTLGNNIATFAGDVQIGTFGNNNAEFALGQTIANKVLSYGAEFHAQNADIQIVLARNNGTSVDGSGAIGASGTNAFHVYDTTSIDKLFQVAQGSGNATFAGTLDVNGTSSSYFYALELERSGSSTTTPDIWGTDNVFVIGTSSSNHVLSFSNSDATFAGDITVNGNSIIETNPTSHSETTWYSITDSHNTVKVKDVNEVFIEKTVSSSGYGYFALHPEQVGKNFDLSFRLSGGTPTSGYRHVAIAIASDGTNTIANYDYLVFRYRADDTSQNQIRVDVASTVEQSSVGSNIPNWFDGTERHVHIQVRDNSYVVEVDGIVEYTATTSTRTRTAGQIGFSIYESGSNANTHVTVRDFKIHHYSDNKTILDGSVGIGETSPTAKLEVVGDTYLRTQVFTNTIRPYSGNQLTLLNGASNYLYINGPVGIGTNTPSKKLHVATTALFGPTGSTSRSTNGVGITFTNNNTFSANADITDANRYLAITNDSTTANAYAPLSFRVNPNGGGSNAMADIKLVSNGSTHHLTTTIRNPATGNFIDTISIAQDGNVGIGTASPSFKLDINAGSNAGVFLSGSSDARYHVFSSSTANWVGYELRSSNANTFAGGIFRHNGDNNRVSLYNKTTEAISLKDGGDVGIGTTSPGAKLDIYSTGSNTRFNSADSTGSYVTFANNGTAKAYIGSAYHLFSSPYNVIDNLGIRSEGAMSFSTGGTTVALHINSSQNATFAGKIFSYARKACSVSISNSYVRVAKIDATTSQLSSGIRISGQSHGSSHVANFTAEILVNHHQDVTIKSFSGAYTQVTLKVESDGNGDYTLSVKSSSANAATYYFTIEAFAGETSISVLPTTTPSTTITHEHTTNFGTHISGTGGTLNSIFDGNVGIGTSSPSAKLHIADDGPDALKIGDTQVSTIGETNDTGYPGMKIVPYNSNIHIGISSTNNNQINLWHAGTNYTYWQQLSTYSVISNYSTNNLVLQVNGGNVGIGTTSPFSTAKLQIKTATDVNIAFQTGTTETSGIKINAFNDAGTANIPLELNGSVILLKTGESERLRINSSGNLLLKGTGVTSLLKFDSSSYGQIQATGNTLYYDVDTQIFRSSAGSEYMRLDSSGNLGLGTTNATPSNGGGMCINGGSITRIDWRNSTTGDATGDGTSLQLNGNDFTIENRESGYVAISTSLSERMRITSDGKVGIGNTSPSQGLHLGDGTDALRGIMAIEGAGGQHLIFSEASGYSSGANAFALRPASGTKFLIQEDGASTVALSVNTNGNVGIGVGAAYKELEVIGDIQLDATDANIWIKSGATGTNGFINWTFNTNDTVYNKIGIDYDTRATTGFHIDAGYPITIDATTRTNFAIAGSNKGAWDSTGLGIGTTSPGAKLDIHTATNSNGLLIREDTDDSITHNFYIDSADNGLAVLYANGQSAKIQLNTAGDSYFNGGNVGIGTASPSYKLEVNGTVKIDSTLTIADTGTSASYIYLLSSATGESELRMGDTDTDAGSIAYNNNGDFMSFRAGAGERMRLESDGDLHVDGDVIAYSTTISDNRLKDNVLTLENSLDKVSKLRGVEYTWNATSRKGQKDIGVIAQEVEKVIPEIVREKEMALIDGGTYKTVDYEKLTAVLIEAIKELKAEVEELKNKCNDCTC